MQELLTIGRCSTKSHQHVMEPHRQRPPRLERILQRHDAPLFFVTAVTWQRQQVLARRNVQEAFEERARQQTDRGICVGRYVIMPDHLHFFIAIAHDQRLSESVKHLKQSITKALRADQADLRVWQPGFFDHLLRSTESYGEKWNYVRQNPVRAGLVTNEDEWPFQGEIVPIARW